MDLEEKEWIRDHAYEYRTVREVTDALNKYFDTDYSAIIVRDKMYTIHKDLDPWKTEITMERKRLETEKVREERLNEKKEAAKRWKPDGFKWVKNYRNYALYERTVRGNVIRACYHYSEVRDNDI